MNDADEKIAPNYEELDRLFLINMLQYPYKEQELDEDETLEEVKEDNSHHYISSIYENKAKLR